MSFRPPYRPPNYPPPIRQQHTTTRPQSIRETSSSYCGRLPSFPPTRLPESHSPSFAGRFAPSDEKYTSQNVAVGHNSNKGPSKTFAYDSLQTGISYNEDPYKSYDTERHAYSKPSQFNDKRLSDNVYISNKQRESYQSQYDDYDDRFFQSSELDATKQGNSQKLAYERQTRAQQGKLGDHVTSNFPKQTFAAPHRFASSSIAATNLPGVDQETSVSLRLSTSISMGISKIRHIQEANQKNVHYFSSPPLMASTDVTQTDRTKQFNLPSHPHSLPQNTQTFMPSTQPLQSVPKSYSDVTNVSTSTQLLHTINRRLTTLNQTFETGTSTYSGTAHLHQETPTQLQPAMDESITGMVQVPSAVGKQLPKMPQPLIAQTSSTSAHITQIMTLPPPTGPLALQGMVQPPQIMQGAAPGMKLPQMMPRAPPGIALPPPGIPPPPPGIPPPPPGITLPPSGMHLPPPGITLPPPHMLQQTPGMAMASSGMAVRPQRIAPPPPGMAQPPPGMAQPPPGMAQPPPLMIQPGVSTTPFPFGAACSVPNLSQPPPGYIGFPHAVVAHSAFASVGHVVAPVYDSVHVKMEDSQDQKMVDKWLSNRKIYKRKDRHSVKIPEGQSVLKAFLTALKQLKVCYAKIKDSGDDHDVLVLTKEAQTLQRLLADLRKGISDEVILQLNKKQKTIQKKRERLKERRRREYEAKIEKLDRRRRRHKEIDQWQRALQEQTDAAKLAQELKASADETLSEVRRKVNDVNKWLAVLTSTRKLRGIRRQTLLQTGQLAHLHTDARFEAGLERTERVLRERLDDYNAEQRALEVMLKTEHQEEEERVSMKEKKEKSTDCTRR